MRAEGHGSGAGREAGDFAREMEFTDRDFSMIRQIVLQRTGIALADHKRELVYGRLAKRLRALGMVSFSQYCDYVEGHQDEELPELVNAITTNLTSFFREPYHFDHLRDVILPDLLHRNASTRRLRIWSAGCSTGEEPYTIGMVVREAFPESLGWDVKILATDIDTAVLERARAGVYPDERAASVPDRYRRRWVMRGSGAHAGRIRMHDSIRALITFRQLNLMDEWPMRGPFDVIFCRNVVIYFDKPTQRRLFERYAALLPRGGHLFVGHSETLFKVSNSFELIGRTIYRRI